MRNLLVFITKYNAFFLFLIFEISALVIYIKYNSFQKATFINSASEVTGNFYQQLNQLNGYLSLKDVNDSLVRENARLRDQLQTSFYIDSAAKHRVNDTVYKQQYQYAEAQVINNSINKRNNYITINIGSNQGVSNGDGVICAQGVVGHVVFVSPHFSIVQSVLNKYTLISAVLADHKDLGSFKWVSDIDPTKGLLTDVSNNAEPKLGEKVITSQYSLFPAGVLIGTVSNLHSTDKQAGSSLNLELKLSVDFSKLQYVYVITNKFSQEQLELEAKEKKDD